MACEHEWQDAFDAFDDQNAAWKTEDDAEDRLEDERGFWEEETAGTGAGAVTIIAAGVGGIATGGTLGLVILGLGLIGGGGAIGYSESDRQDDIDSARRERDAATQAVTRADREYRKAVAKWCRCMAAAVVVTPLPIVTPL